MTSTPGASMHLAGMAFDTIADQYDDLFTRSLIGRAQRNVVWDVLRRTFKPGERILELNCGTGEDALFLSRMGVSVHACDASERMIAVAARRLKSEPQRADVQLEVRPSEQLSDLAVVFDGALSNFSGLNCVADLAAIARHLARLTKPGARLVLCLSTRFCLWEALWYLVHGKPSRAIRRWQGFANATLGETTIRVHYPTARDIRRLFSPAFLLRKHKAVGFAVPPSYVEHLARKHPHLLRKLAAIDRILASCPLVRVLGDHMLLVLERTNA